MQQLLQALWMPMDILFEPGLLTGGNIRVAQLISLVGILLSLVLIIWRRIDKTAKEKVDETKETQNV